MLLVLFVWAMQAADQDYNMIRDLYHSMAKSLEDMAASYDPKSYSAVHLLTVLLPGREMLAWRVSELPLDAQPCETIS